jgi:hypothetical protein
MLIARISAAPQRQAHVSQVWARVSTWVRMRVARSASNVCGSTAWVVGSWLKA